MHSPLTIIRPYPVSSSYFTGSTFISRLTASEAEGLIHDGYIGGGMLPKLNNCTSAIRNGVNRVHILDGRLAHCLLLEIFTNQGIGTAIVSDEE